jgi:hypothetical protein
MQAARRAEDLIAAIARVKELATRLMSAYGALPPFLEQEQALIAAGKLGAVDTIVEGKERLGAEIEASFQGLTEVCAEITRLNAAAGLAQGAPTTLTEAVEALAALVAPLGGEQTLAAEVARRQITSTRQVVADFLDLHRRVKPRIEANRYLLDRLLDNLRLSYRFWQSMTEQVAVPYNAQGEQSTQGRHSGFLVRA